MHVRITGGLVELVSSACGSFTSEQRRAIKFCVKLSKTATKTFEMLKSAYGEESLSRTNLFGWPETFKEEPRKWECIKTMFTALEVEVTLRLTVSQSVSMTWYRAPL
jgi:hypothetical protein